MDPLHTNSFLTWRSSRETIGHRVRVFQKRTTQMFESLATRPNLDIMQTDFIRLKHFLHLFEMILGSKNVIYKTAHQTVRDHIRDWTRLSKRKNLEPYEEHLLLSRELIPRTRIRIKRLELCMEDALYKQTNSMVQEALPETFDQFVQGLRDQEDAKLNGFMESVVKDMMANGTPDEWRQMMIDNASQTWDDILERQRDTSDQEEVLKQWKQTLETDFADDWYAPLRNEKQTADALRLTYDPRTHQPKMDVRYHWMGDKSSATTPKHPIHPHHAHPMPPGGAEEYREQIQQSAQAAGLRPAHKSAVKKTGAGVAKTALAGAALTGFWGFAASVVGQGRSSWDFITSAVSSIVGVTAWGTRLVSTHAASGPSQLYRFARGGNLCDNLYNAATITAVAVRCSTENSWELGIDNLILCAGATLAMFAPSMMQLARVAGSCVSRVVVGASGVFPWCRRTSTTRPNLKPIFNEIIQRQAIVNRVVHTGFAIYMAGWAYYVYNTVVHIPDPLGGPDQLRTAPWDFVSTQFDWDIAAKHLGRYLFAVFINAMGDVVVHHIGQVKRGTQKYNACIAVLQGAVAIGLSLPSLGTSGPLPLTPEEHEQAVTSQERTSMQRHRIHTSFTPLPNGRRAGSTIVQSRTDRPLVIDPELTYREYKQGVNAYTLDPLLTKHSDKFLENQLALMKERKNTPLVTYADNTWGASFDRWLSISDIIMPWASLIGYNLIWDTLPGLINKYTDSSTQMLNATHSSNSTGSGMSELADITGTYAYTTLMPWMKKLNIDEPYPLKSSDPVVTSRPGYVHNPTRTVRDAAYHTVGLMDLGVVLLRYAWFVGPFLFHNQEEVMESALEDLGKKCDQINVIDNRLTNPVDLPSEEDTSRLKMLRETLMRAIELKVQTSSATDYLHDAIWEAQRNGAFGTCTAEVGQWLARYDDANTTNIEPMYQKVLKGAALVATAPVAGATFLASSAYRYAFSTSTLAESDARRDAGIRTSSQRKTKKSIPSVKTSNTRQESIPLPSVNTSNTHQENKFTQPTTEPIQPIFPSPPQSPGERESIMTNVRPRATYIRATPYTQPDATLYTQPDFPPLDIQPRIRVAPSTVPILRSLRPTKDSRGFRSNRLERREMLLKHRVPKPQALLVRGKFPLRIHLWQVCNSELVRLMSADSQDALYDFLFLMQDCGFLDNEGFEVLPGIWLKLCATLVFPATDTVWFRYQISMSDWICKELDQQTSRLGIAAFRKCCSKLAPDSKTIALLKWVTNESHEEWDALLTWSIAWEQKQGRKAAHKRFSRQYLPRDIYGQLRTVMARVLLSE